MKRSVRNITYFLIASMILLLVDLITGWEFINKQGQLITLRAIGSIFMFGTVLSLVNLIRNWSILSEPEKEGE